MEQVIYFDDNMTGLNLEICDLTDDILMFFYQMFPVIASIQASIEGY